MSRYTDVDALIEAMGEEPLVWNEGADEIAERNQWLIDMHIIESAPSIDIVRCKECKHRGICFGRLVQGTKVVQLNFCSYGEREGE